MLENQSNPFCLADPSGSLVDDHIIIKRPNITAHFRISSGVDPKIEGCVTLGKDERALFVFDQSDINQLVLAFKFLKEKLEGSNSLLCPGHFHPECVIARQGVWEIGFWKGRFNHFQHGPLRVFPSDEELNELSETINEIWVKMAKDPKATLCA